MLQSLLSYFVSVKVEKANPRFNLEASEFSLAQFQASSMSESMRQIGGYAFSKTL